MNDIYHFEYLFLELISINEMKIGYQGIQKEKWITYKIEGKGFKYDTLCDEGYTYQIYFISHPAPEKYLKIGTSPVKSRILAFIDCVQDKYNVFSMDNLYSSVTFFKSC